MAAGRWGSGQGVVLRMQVVRSSGVAYYVRDLVESSPDRTRVAGESPGEWMGRGGSVLGLGGRVRSVDFTDVLSGRDPMGDRALRADRGARAVSGVDLVWCAPKSVSLLHLLAPVELAAAAGDAHRTAVADVVGYLERQALGVRRSRGGTTHRLGVAGVVAAGFVHRTSRALDPHLHTHLVCANVAQGTDGVWSSLDTRRLFLHRRALQAVYDSSLRHALTTSAGVSWERSPTGGWDVAGVDPVLSRVFSQRAAAIDEHVYRRFGARSSPRARRVAFHADRPDKDRQQTVDGLRTRWRSQATDHGLDPSDLIDVVGRARLAPAHATPDGDAVVASLTAVLGTRRAVSERDLVAALAESAPAGVPGTWVERTAGSLGRVVSECAGAVNADRRSVAGRQWSTREVTRALGVDAGFGDRRAGPERPAVDDRSMGGTIGAAARDAADRSWDTGRRVLDR